VKALARIAFAWNAFWHAPIRPAALGLFRIMLAVALWDEIDTTRDKSVFAIEGGFHLPYLAVIPLVSEVTYEWIHAVQFVLVALLLLGVAWRATCVALIVLQGWIFFADRLNFRNHPWFFLLILVLMTLSHAGEAFAVPAYVRARRAGLSPADALLGEPRPATFQRLIQVQFCLLYFLAAMQKLSQHYMGGEVLRGILAEDLATKGVGQWIGHVVGEGRLHAALAWPGTWAIMAAQVIVFETFLPLALWFRRTRRVAIVMGTGFHLTIALTMNITVFSAGMISSYLLFLDPETIPRVVRWLLRDRARSALEPAAAT
jgi:hypothetical protein